MKPSRMILFHCLTLLFSATPFIMLAQTDLKYQIPPKDLVAVVDAPADRGPRPAISQVPTGPVVQETSGNKAAVRTNQDMLTGPQDEMLFDYFGQSEVVLINLDGTSRMILPKDSYSRIDVAPGGEYFLAERITKPYSYLVGYTARESGDLLTLF